MIYWKEKHAIIEDGVQRPAGDTPVEGLPLYEDSEKHKAAQIQLRKSDIVAEIQNIEAKVMRNIIALAQAEDTTERGYLDERLAQIEALRQELRTL